MQFYVLKEATMVAHYLHSASQVSMLYLSRRFTNIIFRAIINPKAAKNLYKGLDFYNLSQYDFWHYTGIISLKAAILIIEAYTAFLVIKVLSTIKITNPFTMDVAQRLEKIAYMLMLAWGAIIIYNGQLKWLSKEVAGLQENKLSSELIIYAGLVFVIAQIFKKGVEIQDENELTV